MGVAGVWVRGRGICGQGRQTVAREAVGVSSCRRKALWGAVGSLGFVLEAMWGPWRVGSWEQLPELSCT